MDIYATGFGYPVFQCTCICWDSVWRSGSEWQNEACCTSWLHLTEGFFPEHLPRSKCCLFTKSSLMGSTISARLVGNMSSNWPFLETYGTVLGTSTNSGVLVWQTPLNSASSLLTMFTLFGSCFSTSSAPSTSNARCQKLWVASQERCAWWA